MKTIPVILRLLGGIFLAEMLLLRFDAEYLAVVAFAVAIVAFFQSLPLGGNPDLQPGLDTTD